MKSLLLKLAVVGALGSQVYALDITIPDTQTTAQGPNTTSVGVGSETFWNPYGGPATTMDPRLVNGVKVLEDNEVEPNSGIGQVWDLEAMAAKAGKLYIAGGYDFANGVPSGSHIFRSGDIFVDTAGGTSAAVHTSDGFQNIANNGWEYVIHFDAFDAVQDKGNAVNGGTYTVYKLDGNSVLRSVKYGVNAEANPWRYVSGGAVVTTGAATVNSFNTDQGVDSFLSNDPNNPEFALLGGQHNVLGVDYSFLGGNAATFKYTYGCGNDDIYGHVPGTNVPDVSSTLILGISGLAGLAMARRVAKK